MPSPLNYQRKRNAVLLQIDHGSSNAFDFELIESFNRCLDEIDKNKSLVIIGNGRFFSSGLNLVEMQKLNSQNFEDLINQFQDLLFRILNYPKTVIALINGHSVAGGFILSCACDIRFINGTNFKMGMNDKQMSISLPPIPMAILNTVFGSRLNRILNQYEFLTPESEILKKEFNAIKHSDVDRLMDSQIYKGYKSKHQLFRRAKVDAVKKYLLDNQFQIMEEFIRSWWSQEAVQNRNDIINRLKI